MLIAIKIIYDLFENLFYISNLLTSSKFILFLHFENMFYIQKLVKYDFHLGIFFVFKADLLLLQLIFLIYRVNNQNQFSLYLIIDKAIFQKLRVQKIRLMQNCQSFILKNLLSVTFYNSLTLYNNLAALYKVFNLYNNLIFLHKFINWTS